MRRVLGILTVLALCAGTAWAGRPSPTQEVTPKGVSLTVPKAPDPGAPAGRTERSPLAAAPFDDADVSAERGTGAGRDADTDYYVSTTGSNGNDGLSWGTAWLTIQYAVLTAPDGSTIHVATGTYVEIGQIVIAKNLTITGDPAGGTILKKAENTGDPSSGDSRGWFLVNSGYTLTLAHLTLDGEAPARQICIAVLSFGTVAIDDCTIQNISWTPASYYGRGVCLYAGTANVIRGCTFSNIRRIGVFVFYSGVSASIEHCAYTGKGAGLHLDYAFELGGGGTATITNSSATACTGVASDGSTSAGILITTYWGSGTTGTVLGNKLTGNSTAIAVGYNTADTSTVVAHYNDVSDGLVEGIWNTSSTNSVNAEKNWWGTTNAATIATLIGGLVDYTPFLFNNQIRMAFGGNRLTDTQNPDGGWGWPLSGPSAVNTIGPIAMGLSKAYRATSDPDIYAALLDAGTFLLAKTNNFSPSDGYLAAELDQIFGGTTYVTHLNTNFYGPLAAGTYNRNGLGTLYNTAGYVTLIRTNRASQGIPNLAAWDVGMGLVAAASCGVTGANLAAWIAGVEGEINELEGDGPNNDYDVIGLAGALYGLAFVDEVFDPNAGEHAAASSLADLAGILAGYQITESGGFAWNKNYVIPYDYNETVQETGYAILALEEMGGYDTVTSDAKDWLLSFQLKTGGWMNYGGSTSENNEVTGEALWGIWASAPATLTLEPDDECYADGETVTVELWMHDITQSIVGGQFFLKYDNTKLAFVSATATSPFAELYLVLPGAGLIDYAVQIPPPGTKTGDAKMAVLTFTAIGAICTAPDLITWRAHEPPTRLSDAQGGAVYPDLVSMDVIDNVPPVIVCPVNVTVECDDWPWNHKMHFPQLPDETGWDVNATSPLVLADDWLCTETGPIKDIHFWGSWKGGIPGEIQMFRLSIHANTPGPPSRPGQLLWEREATGIATPIDPPTDQGWYDPSTQTWNHPDHGAYFRYDVIIPPQFWFQQQAGTIYWLDISATVIPPHMWGWKSSKNHFMDDAVWGVTPAGPWHELFNPLPPHESLDLAFVITAGDAPTGVATATDNCDPNPVITYSDVFTPSQPPCDSTGTVTRTWKATDACGNVSRCPQIITINDVTPPTFTFVPPNVGPLNADAGGCTATLVPPMQWATAVDNCDPNPVVTFVRSDGKPNLTDPYPSGTTTITWTAKDCANKQNTAQTTVTVNAVNELKVTVVLDGVVAGGPFTRCITFELWKCPSTKQIVERVVTFTGGSSGLITVPVPCASYECITARDRLHTLRRTAVLSTGGSGPVVYLASFTDPDDLVGGNLNDDKWIDILDFGIFSWQYGWTGDPNTTCSTAYPHADINGDGLVNTLDFTFIGINFLKGHEANCCGAPDGEEGPVTAISVAELIARGMGELAVGDLNGDGWLDQADVAAFMSGARPKTSAVPPTVPPVEQPDSDGAAPNGSSAPGADLN